MTPPLSQYRPQHQHFDPVHALGGYDDIVSWPNGSTSYLLHGELHRTDGPAFVGADGATTWLQFGREHRINGPAILSPHNADEYWINGVQTTNSYNAKHKDVK